MIFLFPLVLSLVGAAAFFLTADAGLGLKLLAIVLAVGAALLMFFTRVTPAVPVTIQIVLCIWFVLYWQIDNLRTWRAGRLQAIVLICGLIKGIRPGRPSLRRRAARVFDSRFDLVPQLERCLARPRLAPRV